VKDRGHAAVELALATAVLLLPVALVVAAFAPWSERRVSAEAIAAEAARAVVLDLDMAAGARSVETQAERMGVDVDLLRVGWCDAVPSDTWSGTCALSRGSVVSVTVELWTPLISTPWGPVGGLWVSGDHSEPIDLYRSLG
jgi:hypothetical protein